MDKPHDVHSIFGAMKFRRLDLARVVRKYAKTESPDFRFFAETLERLMPPELAVIGISYKDSLFSFTATDLSRGAKGSRFRVTVYGDHKTAGIKVERI
jgi:hypothetical protein